MTYTECFKIILEVLLTTPIGWVILTTFAILLVVGFYDELNTRRKKTNSRCKKLRRESSK